LGWEVGAKTFVHSKSPTPLITFSQIYFAIVLDAGRSAYSHPEQNVAEAEKQDDKAETSRASEKKARHEKIPRSEAAETMKDVFKTDESIVAAGPYHTVRAGRQALMSGEMKLMGNVKRDAAREAGFCLAGDSRIKQAHLRHRLDVMLNMSMSFDPATMMCTGCKVGTASMFKNLMCHGYWEKISFYFADSFENVLAVLRIRGPPCLLLMDPDLAIFIIDLQDATKKLFFYIFLLVTRYFVKVHLSHFSKIKSNKEVTKQ
jgi:hypothetical protein